MIISHKYKFVFIHMPKCAGTSVRSRLLELDPEAESYWHKAWVPHLGREVDMAHQLMGDLIAVEKIKRIFQEYFVFTFVRNPYERFLSSLAEYGRERSQPLSAIEVEALLPLLTPDALREKVAYVHFSPLHYFTHVGNKRWVDEIYDFSDIEAGMVRFSEAIGISPGKILPLQSLNVSKGVRRPPEDILSDKVIGDINRIYHRDFELFGYSRIDSAGENGALRESNPSREIQARPDQLRFIDSMLQDISKLDGERRNLLSERQLLLGERDNHLRELRHLYSHLILGRLLKFWRRYVNKNIPAPPAKQQPGES